MKNTKNKEVKAAFQDMRTILVFIGRWNKQKQKRKFRTSAEQTKSF